MTLSSMGIQLSAYRLTFTTSRLRRFDDVLSMKLFDLVAMFVELGNSKDAPFAFKSCCAVVSSKKLRSALMTSFLYTAVGMDQLYGT